MTLDEGGALLGVESFATTAEGYKLLLACGPDVFQLIMGHQLLVWNQAGITCEASFHGISQVNVDLDVAVADSTRMVATGRR